MTFQRVLRAERIKFHRSPVFLAFVVLTLLATFLGTANYQFNLEILKLGWYDLWSQHTLFACSFFLPAELGVLCAWQWRLEHTDHCWNRLMTTPLPFAALYLAKLFWAGVLALAALLFTGVCYLAAGVLVGLPLGGLPPQLAEWLLCAWAGCLVVCAWQELLAMLLRSFALPVAISLVCGVAGLLLMANGYGMAWPWAMISVGMRASDPFRTVNIPQFLGMCAVFSVIPTMLAVALVQRKDICAE